MANRTQSKVATAHGTDPQNLMEAVLRAKIRDTQYWKEFCFGLNAETVIDQAIELRTIGGTWGPLRRPTPFISLVLKLLQIGPDREVILEYIRQEDFKYLTALGAFYLRLVGSGKDVYTYLEPLLADHRKLRVRSYGGYSLTHMDEFIDTLLYAPSACDIALPRLPPRTALEDTGQLSPRKSLLLDLLEPDEVAELDASVSKEALLTEPEPEQADDLEEGEVSGHASKRARTSSSGLFKPMPAHGRGASTANASDQGPGDDIGEWNRIRASLGLRPLRT